MNALAWSAVIWLGLWFGVGFGTLELLALTRRVPWLTLSEFTWGLEDYWRPLSYVVVAGFSILVIHLVVARFH